MIALSLGKQTTVRMEIANNSYGDMLEKYRDVDEDALMADMTEEELLQLEVQLESKIKYQIKLFYFFNHKKKDEQFIHIFTNFFSVLPSFYFNTLQT